MKIQEIQLPAAGLRKEFDNASEVLDLIDKHCQQYLHQVMLANKWLYRGTIQDNLPAFVGNSRQDRKSKDSNEYYSQQYDYMLSLLGIAAQRHNSIFATSRPHHAMTYGTVYVIFPIDHKHVFSYTKEADIVLDHYEALRWANMSKIDDFKDYLRDLEISHPATSVRLAAEMVLNTSDDLVFKSLPGLSRSVLKGHVPEKFWDWKTYLDLGKFVQEFQPRDTDLHVALTKRYEVLINGGYVALKHNVYSDQINARWQVPVANL